MCACREIPEREMDQTWGGVKMDERGWGDVDRPMYKADIGGIFSRREIIIRQREGIAGTTTAGTLSILNGV